MSLLRMRGNILGLMMLAITAVIAGVCSLLLKLPDALVMIGVGVALILMDGIIRLRARPADGWLTKSQRGGFLFFAPAWVVGVVIIAANILSTIFKTK